VNLWQKLEQKIHQTGSFSSIIFAILADLDAGSQARLSLSCGVYGEHGMTVFGNTNNPSVITTSRLATNLVSDYTWCCSMLDTTQSSAHVHIWEKLKANWLKCNVDGAIFSTERKFDMGIWLS
jgi:hypothetical protein